MIAMAIVPLVACGITALALLFLHHRASSQRRAAKAEVDEQVQEMLRQSNALDARLAQGLLGGADVDAAITDFTKARAKIHALPTETPWLWDADDLLRWAKDNHVSRQRGVQGGNYFLLFWHLCAVGGLPLQEVSESLTNLKFARSDSTANRIASAMNAGREDAVDEMSEPKKCSPVSGIASIAAAWGQRIRRATRTEGYRL